MAIKQEIFVKTKRTCLYDKHISLGAMMVEFGGFDMPLLYQSAGIAPEHTAVREHVGLFDVSHMGEVTVKGKDAERYVQHIFTNDIAGAPVGKIYYGMMCYENGGTVDDLLVYKMGENDFFLVINAANIDKDWAWMQEKAEGFDIDLQNRSDYYGQIAVQGPEAEHTVETVLGIPCAEMTFYTCKTIGDVIISRTGYTGEDGFEIYGSHEYINECWDKLIAAFMVMSSLQTSLRLWQALVCSLNSIRLSLSERRLLLSRRLRDQQRNLLVLNSSTRLSHVMVTPYLIVR